MRPLSARNPRVQALARLVRQREERAGQRAFVVEGPTLLATAIDAGIGLVDVFVDEAGVERPTVATVLGRLPADVDPWVLPPGVLERVGDAVTSQGILAVVERRDPPMPTPDQADLVLVLADVSDPGNAGTLIRAAAAAGAGAVVVAAGVDPTSPKVVRSSAGAVFAVDVVRSPSIEDALTHLAALGYRMVATVVDGGTPYDHADLTGAVALVLGNEAHGLPPAVAAGLEPVTIPMADATESLNVAMAGTVLAFEARRQRRASGSAPD